LAALFLLAILYMTWIKKYFISQRDTSERNQVANVQEDMFGKKSVLMG